MQPGTHVDDGWMRSRRVPVPEPSPPQQADRRADDPAAPSAVLLAGYRPLRRLSADLGGSLARGATGEPVLIDVVAADDAEEQNRLARRLRAVDRLDHPHVQRVVDLGDAAGGSIVLVSAPAPERTLARVLARRRRFAAGEIVTLFVPLVSAVRHCHDHAVAHGALNANSIGLTAEGSPFLRGFGAAVVTEGRRDRRTLEAADVSALVGLVERCWPPLGSGGTPPSSLDELEAYLFTLAEPLALAEDDPRPEENGPDVRSAFDLGPVQPKPAAAQSESARTAPRRPARPRGEHRSEGPEGMLSRLLPVLARRRGPLVVAVSVVAAAGIALTALSGQGEVSSAATTAPPGAPPTSEARTPAPASDPAIGPSPEPGSGDPVEAVRVLIVVLRGCAGAAEPDCADPFLTSDSPLRGRSASEWADFAEADPATARAGDRNGDAAIVTVGGPETATASALVVRTEAGWLLRDLFGPG